jgi:hypothetical protein
MNLRRRLERIERAARAARLTPSTGQPANNAPIEVYGMVLQLLYDAGGGPMPAMPVEFAEHQSVLEDLWPYRDAIWQMQRFVNGPQNC